MIWLLVIAALLAALLIGLSRGWLKSNLFRWLLCLNELEPENDAQIFTEGSADAKLREQIAKSLEGDKAAKEKTEAEVARAEIDEDLRVPELEAYAKAEAEKRAEATRKMEEAQKEAMEAKAEVKRLRAEAERLKMEAEAQKRTEAETEAKTEAEVARAEVKAEANVEDKSAVYCRLHKASSTIDFLSFEKARAVKLAYGYGESFSMADFAAFNALSKVEKIQVTLMTDSGEIEINAVPLILAEGRFTLEGDCWKQEPKGPELFLNAENRLITQQELDRAEVDLGIDRQKLLGSGAYKKVLGIQAELTCIYQTGSASYSTGYFLRLNNAQLLRGLSKK